MNEGVSEELNAENIIMCLLNFLCPINNILYGILPNLMPTEIFCYYYSIREFDVVSEWYNTSTAQVSNWQDQCKQQHNDYTDFYIIILGNFSIGKIYHKNFVVTAAYIYREFNFGVFNVCSRLDL